ncbi:MAG TPA: trypsin-like peptidase domain-containing protein [Solirubrobacterales bacterium]|nr:trypsin-like peptidase domain-containing protein [Solirubrobacterales bacterium]
MTRVLAALAVVLALVFAGCGGGDDGGDVTTTIETQTGSGKPIPGGSGFNAQAVFDRAAPGVVTVFSVFDGSSATDVLEGGGGGGPQAGQGSGFVISEDGEIVTNAHVVTDGQTGGGDINQANEVFVQFPDRNTVEAEVIGFDPFGDVALLKVDPEGLDIQPVELGDIEDVEVGEEVAALGSPFGEEQSLSVGVVSQTDRAIPSLTTFSIDGAIQTDASINPGNSGGPLLDSEAKVIGINQQIDTTSGGNQGVGFAVPVDLFERSIDQLREDGQVDYAFIGVTTTALFPQLAEELDAGTDKGVIVAEVSKNSPAEEAGIQPADQQIDFQIFQDLDVGGDIIVSVDGEEISDAEDLPRIISRKDPGETVTLGIVRNGEETEVDVTLEQRPDTPAAPEEG